MDESAREPATTFTHAARTRRMLERLLEGRGDRDVAGAEGLSDRRVGQVVAGRPFPAPVAPPLAQPSPWNFQTCRSWRSRILCPFSGGNALKTLDWRALFAAF